MMGARGHKYRGYMTRKEKTEAFVDEGYNVAVTGRHVQVTEPMKDYAIEKISKLERLSPRLIEVNVTMDVQKLEHRVDIWMQFNQIKIKSHAAELDMYAAIDKAVDRLRYQILKYKDRIQEHHARGVAEVDMNVNVIQAHRDDDLNDINGDIEDANRDRMIERFKPHQVVARETKKLKTLRVDEAVMKLELSGDAFLIYRSEEEGSKLRIMYKRKDGNFGIITPEA